LNSILLFFIKRRINKFKDIDCVISTRL